MQSLSGVDLCNNMNFYIMDTTFWMYFVSLLSITPGTFIDVKPTDTWGMVGSDAVITCTVTIQTPNKYVFWKKVNLVGSDVVTYDNQTMKVGKYEIQGTYNLVIKNVELSDEGHYDLDTEEEIVRIYLFVAVPMNEMTITWGGVIPFIQGSEANLTCNSSNSRPAADIRWFKGSRDISDEAHTNIKITRADGYGDSVSIIRTVIGSVDVPYLCVADLPEHKAVRTQIAFPPLIGGSSVTCIPRMDFVISAGICGYLLNILIVKYS